MRQRLTIGVAALAAVMAVPAGAASATTAAVQGRASQVTASSSIDREVESFYRARDNRPLWIRRGTLIPESLRMVDAVRDLAGPGSEEAAELDAVVEAARSGDPSALDEAETRLTRALLTYAGGARAGVDVGMVYIDRELAPRSARGGDGRIADADDIRRALADLDEGNPIHLGLRRGLALYRQRWSSLPQVQIPAGPAIRAGQRGARVQALRRRLGLSERGTFDAELGQAVRAYKRSHGLGSDAVADARTIASLNLGAGHYERLIRVNIARAEALPADPRLRYVLVDAADARLWMYEDGRAVDNMRVIVGKPTEQTPMMAALLRYAALNPVWNIPPDLARERIAPGAIRGGEAYLRDRGYRVLSDWTDDAVAVHPSRVDWSAIASGRQEARVIQLPGPDNFMGRMKLMMPNRLGIYLHDTPDRALFDEPDRRLSSGCVRLEDADRLARWLFGRTIAPRTGEAEERVNLRRPVPVYITYLTAAPSEDGIVFRPDIYNRDPALLAQLGGGSGTRRTSR